MNPINIAFQSELSYLIPKIPNHKDYAEFRSLIERIDEILKISSLDLHFADEYVSKIIESHKSQGNKKELSSKQI